ncbi:MAG: DnaA regulatory inactivator Hda [Legionellaceae bacterium]|nr:DnaA regulatory inactivator Hda [Legionellaceae bacterium]HAF88131.1 DnaA regulatory inactivator Hda [Legionellales bacterium]HCA89260.1 DnaA regulatory inactivator Hda [Legionellales bacterium]|tara:strand:- start:194 stop:892 length:699 start_codon:yes stop_codon:yes gene_type:complete
MTSQLPLAFNATYQATLQDFNWQQNTLLQQQLIQALDNQSERLFYLWGPSGSGKSHILQACCQYLSEFNQTSIYLPLKLLTDCSPHVLEELEQQNLVAIDDIEAIALDRVWEEGLFHLYNRIKENDRTLLIVSGHNPPNLLPLKLADLRSRLSWGLVCQIKSLNDEAKIDVLQQKAHKKGLILTHAAALFLINRSPRDMGALVQLLDKLDAASLVAKRRITIPFIKDILGWR